MTGAGVALGTTALKALTREPIDTLLVPGAHEPALRALLQDQEARAWVITEAPRAHRVASVCTGAIALAAWGLLDGKRAATHWEATSALARHFPQVLVEADALFVEDGAIWTSAGVSTGIDMALAIVTRDLGREVASKLARRFVLQLRRPGHQSQFSPMLQAQAGAYAELVAWIEANLASELGLDALAAWVGQAPRTFHRHFSAQTGLTPAAFVERLRLDRARALLEAGQSPKVVASAAGFGSLDRLGRLFKRRIGLSPSAYRTLHGWRAEDEPEASQRV